MKADVGTLDRTLRIGAGVVLIGFSATDVIGPLGYLGIIPLLTGLVSVYPAYSLLGVNRCPCTER